MPSQKLIAQMKQKTATMTQTKRLTYLTYLTSQTEIDALCFLYKDCFMQHYFEEYVSEKFGEHHQQILDIFQPGDTGKHINIIAPRGSAKSTCMAIILPLHCIFYKSLYTEPHHFIIIVSRSHTMSKSRVQDIKRKIEIDARFQHLKGEINWGEERIITSNNTLIVPKGRGGQIRGSLFGAARPDLIISDDLDDPETVMNPEVRQKDQIWFDTDFIRAGSPNGKTNFINVDTIKHEEATTALLRNRTGWQSLFFQAIKHPADLWHPTQEEKWREWEKIYTDMSLVDDERIAKADAFYEKHKAQLTEDVEELWPGVITYYNIRKEICDIGYFAVLRELQNSLRDPSRALFDMENAIRFNVVEEGFLRSDKVLVRWSEMIGATIFLDWAGGKDIKENAYAAVVSVVWVPQPGSREENVDSLVGGNHGYVLGADIRRIDADRQISACFEMYDMVKSIVRNRDIQIRLGIEGFVQDTWQAQRQVIERAFRKHREARNISGLSINWLPRLINKYDRIDALQPIIRNGWLAFNNGLPNEFWKQMRLYPTGDFLDAPDALEGACQLRVTRRPSERAAKKKASRRQAENRKVTL